MSNRAVLLWQNLKPKRAGNLPVCSFAKANNFPVCSFAKANKMRSPAYLILALLLFIGGLCAADADVAFLVDPPKPGAVAKAPLPCRTVNATLLSCVIDGNYDLANPAARVDLANGALTQLTDQYDYLVVFTTFDFDKGSAAAFYSGVRNDIQGIGQPVFNNSVSYGSANKLRGIVDMGNMRNLSFAPGAPAYRNNLNIFLHEVMHTFGVYVKYTDASGALSSGLLGAQGAHWNYFLDSDASVMYGADWRDFNSQFQAADTLHRYSDLDLYLAGFLGANEVGNISVIRGGTGEASAYPVLGAITPGTRENVSISQIISANGARVPDVAAAQKHFRAAFVLLTRPADSVNPQLIASLERFRLAAQERFTAMTHGRGSLEISARKKVATFANSACAGPLVPASTEGTDVLEASKRWLTLPQTSALPCNDPGNLQPVTYYRSIPAMASKLLYLREFPDVQGQVVSLTATLLAAQPSTVDDAAWLLRALPEHAAALALLKTAASSNGGYASTPWFQPNVGDTALALSALPVSETALRAGAVSYLRQRALAGNGFALIDGGPTRVLGTAEVIRAFNIASISGTDPQIAAALTLLASRKLAGGQYRGGYSDYPNSASYTPSLMETLTPLGLNASTDSESYVRRAFQEVNLTSGILAGNFLDDDYTTANAGRILILNTKPNLTVGSIRLVNVGTVLEGQRVTIEAEVKNDSSFNIVTPFKIQWFDGDPAAGGVAIGAPIVIASLAQNAGKIESLTLDTTGRGGMSSIYLSLDTERVVDERKEQDNISFKTFNVTPAPSAADLIIETMVANPASLVNFPSSVEFRGVLHNRGLTSVNQAVVAVFARQFSGRQELARTNVNVAAQSRTPFVISHTFNSGDELRMAIVADPQNLITEALEDNNEFLLSLDLESNVDFEVLETDIEAPVELIAGDVAAFKVTFRNRGVRPSPVVRAQLSVNRCKAPGLGDAVQGIMIPSGASVQKLFTVTVPTAGAFTVCAEIDPENVLPESSEANNQASKTLTSVAPTQPNLAFVTDSLTFTPDPALEGGAVIVGARAVNFGAATTVPVSVNLYAQDPATNPAILGVATLPAMATGAQLPVTINVAALALRGLQTMQLKIDPANIVQERNESDNIIIRELNVLSFPDLITNVSGIRLTPSQPIVGQNVVATIALLNTGGQEARNFQVELREGAADGVLVGPAQTVLSLLPSSARELSFSWIFGQTPGANKVTVKIDALNTVVETNEGNNTATLNLTTQTGNQFSTERYFSPNGDGIKDTTSAIFRFNESRSVDVIVRQSATTREVRRFTGPELTNRQSVQITWDGKEQAGENASDGDYLIEARDRSTNASLSFTLVTLDTNKSSLLSALGTRYANKRLRASEDISDALIPPITSTFRYSAISVQRTNTGGQQIARFDTTSGKSDAVISAGWFQQRLLTGVVSIWLSPNGERVYFAHKPSVGARKFFYAPLNSVDRATEISVLAPGLPDALTSFEMMDEQTIYAGAQNSNYTIAVQTGVVTQLRDKPPGVDFLFLRPDGVAFVKPHLSFIFVPRDGGLPIFTNAGYRHEITDVTPDKRWVLVNAVSQFGSNAEIRLLDLVRRTNVVISQGAHSAYFVNGGEKIAVFNKSDVKYISLQGVILDVIAVPKPNYTYTDMRYDSREYDFKNNEVIAGFDGLHRPCAATPVVFALHKTVQANRFSGLYGDNLTLRPNCMNASGSPLDIAFARGAVTELQFFPGARRFIQGNAYSDWAVESSVGLSRFQKITNSTAPRLTYSGSLDLALQLFSKDSSIVESTTEQGALRKRALYPVGPVNSIPSDFPGQYLWADETRATFGDDEVKYGVYQAKKLQSSVFSSYANLSVALSSQTVAEGVALKGIAADENFDYYKIDYALESAPNLWLDLVAEQSDEFFGGTFNVVTLPEVTNYIFRLTAQDKAGNSAVSYSRARNEAAPAAIQGIIMTPSHISPNGDGVQDEFKLDFNVTRPVSQSVLIFDAAGVMLQSIPLNFSASQLGNQQRPLTELDNFPDGEYRIKLGATERTVIVDRVAPMPCLNLDTCISLVPTKLDFDSQYAFGKNYKFGYVTTPDIYEEVVLQRKKYTETSWQDLRTLTPSILKSLIPLSLYDFDASKLRIRYKDLAGNSSVSLDLDTKPDLLLSAVTAVEQPGISEIVPDANPQLQTAWAIDAERHVYLHFDEATFSRLHDISVNVTDVLSGATMRQFPIPPAQLATSTFLIDFAVSKNPPSTPLSRQEKFVNPRRVQLPDDPSYADQILVNISGKTPQEDLVYSNAIKLKRQIIYGPYELYVDRPLNEATEFKSIRQRLINNFPLPDSKKNYVWVHAASGVYDVPIDLVPIAIPTLGSGPSKIPPVAPFSDVIYNDGQNVVFEAPRPFNGYDSCKYPTAEPPDYKSFQFIWRKDSAVLNFTRAVESNVFENPIPALHGGKIPNTLCGAGNVKVEPIKQTCDVNVEMLDFKFFQRCAAPDRAKKILIYAVNLSNGESRDIYEEINPVKPCPLNDDPWYSTTLDVATWPEGPYQFVVAVGGTSEDRSLFQGLWTTSRMIQHEQPQLRIDNPRGKFCRIGGVRPLLVSGVALAPRFGADLDVELVGETTVVSNPEIKTLATFAKFPDSFLSAELETRLQSEDDFLVKAKLRSPNGRLACAETAFEYDGNVRATLIKQPGPFKSGVPRLGLSRVGEAAYRTVESRFSISERLSHQTSLVPVAVSGLGAVTQVGAGLGFAQGILNSGAGVGINAAIAIDGSPGGVDAPDGLYLVKSVFTDDCLNTKASGPLLEIDSTPPLITLRSPSNGAVVAASLATAVNAIITDRNMRSWQLVDAGGVTVLSGVQAIDGVLGSWNTAQLSGPQPLILRAFDVLGNKREVSFSVTITALPPSSALLSYTASPTLISPNNDAVLDETQLRYSLKSAARVTLKLLGASGVVATLVNDELKPAGNYSLPWRGLNAANAVLADAAYRAEITVLGSAPGSVVETETLVVTLDTTPPVLELVRPNSAFVDASGYAKARFTDLHFDFADAELIPPGANIVPQRLSNILEGEQFLFDLSSLVDGDARLRLEARDLAGNRALLERTFTIDRTPPAVALVVPADAALLATRLGVVRVKGSATDLHFASRELSLQSTAVGAVPQILQTAATPVSDAEFYTFNPNAPDGSYRMTLKATDVVGLSSAVTHSVEIDNTPPVVGIDAPLADAIVGSELEVRGSVADEHLERYSVAIANLADATANRWTELAADTVVRDNVVLSSNVLSVPDGAYKLRLSALDRLGHSAERIIAVTVDSLPPPAPINLTASSNDQTNVDLRWNPVSVPDLAGYAIYREGIRLNTALNVAASYRDANAPEAQLHYQVSAVDRGGNESTRSNVADVSLDRSPPDVAIVQPENNARVRGVFDVVGTAFTTQDDFGRYKLTATPIVPTGPPAVLTDSPQAVQIGKLGVFSSTGFAAETRVRLNLSAFDTNNNTASTAIEIVVDNVAPTTPLNLSLSLSCATGVQASWTALSVSDLLGYILYRDGELVNYAGSVPADLRPFAINATSFTDTNVGDGAHTYSLYAIDLAGNTSANAATSNITRSCGPPDLTLVEPALNQEFELSIDVLGESNDRDIASVAFSARRVGDPSWISLGAPVTVAPYRARFTPAQGSALGDYDIQGIATDTSALVDPTPALVRVRYVDKTPPALPLNLTARVDEGQIRLTWSASSSSDVQLYRVNSNYDGVIAPATPLALSLTQESRPDFDYRFSVQAVDVSNNFSNFSNPATPALVYTPRVSQPYTPVMASALVLTGTSVRAGSVQLRRDAVDIASVNTDAAGAFSAAVTLARGTHSYDAKITQSSGDKSKRAAIVMGFDAKPAAPTGLAVLATGNSVRASWAMNPEDNILGYRLFRNLSPVLLDRDAANIVAFNQFDGLIPELTDTELATFWRVNYSAQGSYVPGTYAELRLPAPIVVSGIKLQWHTLRTRAVDYRIEARFVDDIYVPVANVSGNDALTNEVLFTQPYRTDRLRIVPVVPTYLEPIELSTASVIERPLLNGLTNTDTLTDGRYDFQVSALNTYAFESALSPAVRLDLGDVTPPPAVVLNGVLTGSDITLNWNAANVPDTAFYDLYRDGAKIARINHPALTYVDVRLRNGSYRYVVRALDRFENASIASNEVSFTVNVTRLNKPENLRVIAVPAGRALDVSWQPAAGPQPSYYRVRRSLVQAGPFTLISSPSATNLRDLGLNNGTRYWYTVEALDLAGNESGQTDPVSGVPLDSAPPVSAALIAPTLPGRPIVVRAVTASIAGFASGSERVQIYQNGSPLAPIPVSVSQTTATSPGFTVSTDGITAAPIGPLVYVHTFSDATLWNTATDARLSVAEGAAVFSADAVDLYVVSPPTTTLSSIKRVNTITNVSTDVELGVTSIAFALPVALPSTVPGAEKLLVGGVRTVANVATDGLWLVDPANLAAMQMLGAQPSLALNAATARVAPDGKTAAVLRNDGHLLLITFATASVQDIASNVSDAPALQRDSGAIVFTQAIGAFQQLMLYSTLDQSTRVWLSAPNASYSLPIFDNSGVALLTRKTDATSTKIESRLWPEGALNGSTSNAERFVFLGNAQWLLNSFNDMRRISPAGWFGVELAPLRPGENLYTAVALDAAGNASQASPAISITSLAPSLLKPDLATSASDIRFIPPSALVGTDVGALVTVRNLGAAPSPASSLSARVRKPNGSLVTLPIRVVPALAIGAQATLSLPLGVQSAAGLVGLTVQIDPANALDESNEANNAASAELPITVDGRPTISVVADQLTFAPGVEPSAALTVLNPASRFAGKIKVRVEDASGALVLELADVVVPSLNFGQVFNGRVRWPNTNAFAGSYRFNAKLLDDQGDVVAADIAGFAISANRTIALGIATDRTSYSRSTSTSARVSVPLSFTSGNTVLENAQLQIVVRNALGTEIARSDRTLGTLLPGYQGQSVLNVPLANLAAGVYTASADLAALDYNTGAQRSFLVLDDTPPAQLAGGTISLSSNPLGITLPGTAEAIVSNIGSAAIAPMLARMSLISSPGLAQIRQEQASSSLNPGASMRVPMNLGALNLALGNYLLVLEGQYPSDPTWRQLASRSLTVTDLIAPEITPLTPDSAGTPMRLPALLTARVVDRHSAVATVEIQIDGGAYQPVARDVDGSYGAQLSALSDGTHSVSWRAVDSYGNQSQTQPAPFVIDTTPPVIVITGVSEGQISATALNPAYVVTDNDLASSGATLNGAPFVSASQVALDNSYTLYVYGSDRAGNRSDRTVRFIIERAPPELSFVQPLNSEVIDAASTEAILRTEPFASVTLNVGGFSATAAADQFGTVTIASVPLMVGANTLSARATDRAGNQSAIVSVSVTRPQSSLSLSGTLTASGAQIALGVPVNLGFAVNNAATTALTALPLRLRLYANSSALPIASREFNRDIAALGSISGTENFAANLFALGSYSASLEANVGGAWTLLADAGFSIVDTTPPALSVQLPTVNQVLGASVRFKVSASDAQSGLNVVDYRVDGGVWITFGAGVAGQFESGTLDAVSEGAHSFQARASDLAGNVTTGSAIAFAMDRTPPAISIANVAEGGLYNVTVTPGISITDAHSFTQTQTLNGASYVSGTGIVSDGSYTLAVTAVDLVGNASAATVRFVIDKTPPLVSFTYPANAAVLGVDFTRIDGRTEASANVRLTLAGVNYLVRADAQGAFQVPSVPLQDGNNAVAARATDAAGNTGPDASLSIIYRLNAGALISGSLSPFGSAIPLGQPITAQYRLRNTGAGTIRNLPVRIELQRSGGAVLATQEFSLAELLAGAPNEGSRVFQSTGQVPGGYVVVLSAQLPDPAGGALTWAALDSQALLLGDIVPPVVTISAPPANSYQRGDFTTLVRATDLNSAIARVEAKLSDNAWVELLAVPGQPGNYSGVVAHNIEEATAISARATDAAGNVSAIVTRPVLIDLNVPVIAVPNIAEAALLNAAVTPVITVQDFSPTQKVTTLNGAPYSEGSAISSDGDYLLRISATDSVARTSVLERRFKIDRTPPVISITYPPKGLSTQLGQVRVSGLTEGLAAVTLRNATLTSVVPADAQGGFSLAEMPLTIGDNILTAQARDLAGNLSNIASVTVVRVGVNGAGLDGVMEPLPAESTHGQPVAVRAALINIGTVDLAGTPMRWVARAILGGVELAERPFALTLAAGRPLVVQANFPTSTWPLGSVDIGLETQLTSAGRASAAWRVLDHKATLIVDRAPPVIRWITPVADAYVVPGELLITDAFDALSGVASVEAKIDDGRWQLMSPRAGEFNRFAISMPDAPAGPHTLTARAADVSGNTASTPPLPIRVREVLALTIDTPLENAQLSTASTTVSGLTKPRALVVLTTALASFTTSAGGDGRYNIYNVGLNPGSNTLRALASDADGNSSLPVLRTVRVVLPTQAVPVPLKPITYWLMLGVMLLLGLLALRRGAR
jgi:subtilase family serine protease